MTKILSAIVLAIAAVFVCAHVSAGEPSGDDSGIRAVIFSQLDYLERGRISEVLQLYAEDAVFFSNNHKQTYSEFKKSMKQLEKLYAMQKAYADGNAADLLRITAEIGGDPLDQQTIKALKQMRGTDEEKILVEQTAVMCKPLFAALDRLKQTVTAMKKTIKIESVKIDGSTAEAVYRSAAADEKNFELTGKTDHTTMTLNKKEGKWLIVKTVTVTK